MYKHLKLTIVVSLIAILALTGAAYAQGPGPQHTSPTWQVSYWNNVTLSGTPALQRNEADLDYNWGTGSPDGRVHADGFSARWSRYIDVTPGVYQFTAAADDGVRLYVDDELVVDDWSDHPARTVSGTKNLVTGHHLVTVDYYENGGLASISVSWAPAAPTIRNWRAEYYNNMSLSGAPVLVRDDARLDFAWGGGSPAPGIVAADHFSARWTRTVNLPAGSYHFAVTADDGVRFWVNDHLLVDAWYDQAALTHTGDMYLPGGSVALKVEYYENAGDAVARLSWNEGNGQAPGEVVVDDTDSGFIRGGSPTGWHTAPEGFDGRLTWTRNNDAQRANYNWAHWTPNLAPGRYEVFVYIPDRYTTTGNARYWISHANGFTLRVVNQSAYKDQWVSLGTYWFQGAENEYVSLSDISYEQRLTRLIAFDAVKWVPR